MSKSIFKQTDLENLISNLRGEVGEIIQSWSLMKDFYILSAQMQTEDISQDMENQDLAKVNLIKKKFQNDIISNLSELGYKKYGQINFFIASSKLNKFHLKVKKFEDFLKKFKFIDKRNEFISHKKLPPTWDDHVGEYRIPYITILRGISLALILMKKIDYVFLVPKSKFQWHEMRKRRYNYSIPAKAAYLLLPYLTIKGQENIPNGP